MSKGLEALKRLNNVVAYDENEELIPIDKDLSIIEKELKKGEKAQLKLKALGNFVLKSKALEILKAFDFEIEDYTEDENGSIKAKYHRIILDDEEIDLLKEALL